MTTYLMGKAPLTVVRLSNGSRANVAAGALVPSSVEAEDAKRLLEEGYLEEVEVVDEESEIEEPAAEPTTIPDILADVDGDPEKAKAYLEAEREKGDDARKSLVEKLEAVIAGGNG